MANWKDFCKVAQTWGYFAPAHEPSAAKAWNKATVPIADKVIKAPINSVSSAAGSLVGAGKAWWDTMGRTGLGSGPGWWAAQSVHPELRPDIGVYADAGDQILRGAAVGAKEGWRSGDRVAHDTMTTVARVGNDFGLVSDESMNQMRMDNDNKMLENMRRLNVPLPKKLPRDPETGLLAATGDPDYEEYDRFVNWARAGQGTGRFAFDAAALAAATHAMGAAGGSVGKSVGAAPETVARLSAAGAAIPTAAATTKTLSGDVASGSREADQMNVYEYRQMAEAMKEMDTSSQEYRELYDVMKRFSNIDAPSFKTIRKPSAPFVGSGNVTQGTDSTGVRNVPEKGWSMSPYAQNIILGGLGIGSLLGGWKLGLLGLLLGAMHGGVGIRNLWNNISKSFNGSRS